MSLCHPTATPPQGSVGQPDSPAVGKQGSRMGGTKLPRENSPSHLGLSCVPSLLSSCNRRQHNPAIATSSWTWRPLSTSPQLRRTNNTDIMAPTLTKMLICSLLAQGMTTLALPASRAKAPQYSMSLFMQANVLMQTCSHAHICTCLLPWVLSEQGHCTSPPVPPKREALTVSYTVEGLSRHAPT